MDKPTKLALGGIALGLAALGLGYVGQKLSESRVAALVAKCNGGFSSPNAGRRGSPVDLSKLSDDELQVLNSEAKKREATSRALNEALKNADAEKNTAVATALANEIVRLRTTGDTGSPGSIAASPIGNDCEPNTISTSSDGWENAPPAIRAEIDVENRRGQEWMTNGVEAALFISFIAAIPFVWYFLLRRLRELREAVIGR